MSRSDVIILFPDPWLPYSPTILNIQSILEKNGISLTIICFDNNKYFPKTFNPGNNIIVKKVNPIIYKILGATKILDIFKILTLIIEALKHKNKNTTIIGVDATGIFAARLLSATAIFLSLEAKNSIFLTLTKILQISTAIFQTKERADYLIDAARTEIFYLPNSPIIKTIPSQRKRSEPLKFIYLGNIIQSHGIEACIDGVLAMEGSPSIHIRGPVTSNYRGFLEGKYREFIGRQLSISSEYIEQESVQQEISYFDIGFVLYDFSILQKSDFNYTSSPSGKLFNYYASGIPVIGTKVSGLESVEAYSAGVLINDATPELIVNAATKILANYEDFSKNALRASIAFDFEKSFNPIMQRLLEPHPHS